MSRLYRDLSVIVLTMLYTRRDEYGLWPVVVRLKNAKFTKNARKGRRIIVWELWQSYKHISCRFFAQYSCLLELGLALFYRVIAVLSS